MRLSKDSFGTSSFVQLQDINWLNKQRIAGKITAQTLSMLENYVKEKTTYSLIELNNIAEEFIVKSGGIPTFKNYKSFPAGVCISVNKELVHGIPKDYKLQDGDIVSFDLGVTFEGAIADSALTCIFGSPKSEQHVKLINTTQESLMKGISAIKVGNRLGCIGHAIYKHIKSNGFGVIDRYGGHGITYNTPHAEPFVPNKANPEDGIVIQPGLCIAIEPMAIIGDTHTRVESDGWTVVGSGESAHFEHSVFVHENHVEILTERS